MVPVSLLELVFVGLSLRLEGSHGLQLFLVELDGVFCAVLALHFAVRRLEVVLEKLVLQLFGVACGRLLCLARCLLLQSQFDLCVAFHCVAGD